MQGEEVYEKFIKGSIIVALTLGGGLGALLLASVTTSLPLSIPWRLVQSHAHFQLFGWLGLFVMGIAYHVIPRFKATELYSKPLANLSFWLVLAGILTHGATVVAMGGSVLTLALVFSGLLEVAGVGLFVYVVLKTVISSEQKPEFFEKYVVIGLLWFFLGSVLNLGNSVYMLQRGLQTIPQQGNEALIHILLIGFATVMIMGVGVRTLPVFLGLRAAREKPVSYSLVLLNLGILLRVIILLILPESPAFPALLQVSAILEFAAVVVFVYGLNIFAKPEIELPPMEASTNYERSVKGAYLWLIFAVTLDLYLALTAPGTRGTFIRGAHIHALTVGFITMMMFGYATRIIPIFKGVDLHSLRLADSALFMLIGSNIFRVGLELFYLYTGPFKALLGLSGFVTLAAYAVFGYNIWMTINKPYEEE